MGKVSVAIYIAVAVLLLLLISRSSHNDKPGGGRHRHRRLKIRSNFSFADTHRHPHERIAPFDPLVADIERKRENREWEHQFFLNPNPKTTHESEWEDFMDAEDYLNDEDKFNVTDRLVLLFPRIDVDPADGYVSESEMTRWNLEQSQREVMHRTEREMKVHDKNKDGFVSFAEHEPPTWARDSDNNSFGYNMGWWKEEHFNASDADGDGLLNITEFNDFLHPADTNNSKLINWLCKEEIRERDSDKDDKINFEEFFHGLFDLVRNYDDESDDAPPESDDSLKNPAKKLFGLLDKDGDGHLSAVELLPIIGKIHPSEQYYAKRQTEYIMQQADVDKNRRLTLSEMVENPYVFYSAVFNDEEDDNDDYGFHDEFR